MATSLVCSFLAHPAVAYTQIELLHIHVGNKNDTPVTRVTRRDEKPISVRSAEVHLVLPAVLLLIREL